MSNSEYELLLKTEKQDLAKTLQGKIKSLDLRIKLETEFMRDTEHNYMYFITPTTLAGDLREIVFGSEEYVKTLLLAEIKQNALHNNSIPHILTDIDDTLFPNCNGIFETFGSDTSWSSLKPYPGVKLFYELFYKNLTTEETQYSTILTGTPACFKGQRIHNETIKDTLGHNFGFIQGFDRKRDALYSLCKGMYEQPFYKFAPSATDLAHIKFNRFKQYKALFPEYKLLFIGDNGQGDLLAGKKIIEEDPSAQVFIHNLLKNNAFIFSEEQITTHKSSNLFFFKNYLELGYIFSKQGYLTKDDFLDLRKNIAEELILTQKSDKDRRHFFHYMRRKTYKLKRH